MARALKAPHDPFYQVFNLETRNDREIGRFSSLEENLAYVCGRIGVRLEAGRLMQAARIRRDFIASVLVPRAQAMPTLTRLNSMDLRLGLISDCSPEVPSLYRETPFAPLMQVSVFSNEVGTKKPDPEMYRRACEGLKVRPEQALYVGDGGSNELSGALSYGMSAVLIRPPGEEFGSEYRPEAMSWDGEAIATLGELFELMQARG